MFIIILDCANEGVSIIKLTPEQEDKFEMMDDPEMFIEEELGISLSNANYMVSNLSNNLHIHIENMSTLKYDDINSITSYDLSMKDVSTLNLL